MTENSMPDREGGGVDRGFREIPLWDWPAGSVVPAVREPLAAPRVHWCSTDMSEPSSRKLAL